ncbi:TPA: cysteine peptidase family C39 domain-containing protein, partial [Enterobacter roggenkampii]
MNISQKSFHKSNALNALSIISSYHGQVVNLEDVRHRYDPDGSGLSQTQWLIAARELGLKVRVVKSELKEVKNDVLPVLIWKEEGDHFILAKVDGEKYLIHDLELRKPFVLTRQEFEERYSGTLIMVTSRA